MILRLRKRKLQLLPSVMMKAQKLELSLTVQISVVGTDAGSESTASRVEIFIVWMPINDIHRPEGRRLILQLLNSGNSSETDAEVRSYRSSGVAECSRFNRRRRSIQARSRTSDCYR